MAMVINDNSVTFEGVVYDDVIADVREVMQEKAPSALEFHFESCDDVHLAVLQLIMAYTKLYESHYHFGDEVKIYQKVLTGFDVSEKYCN